MALKPTNLYLEMAPLPATFKGSPQDLAVLMIQRMKILSPNGTNFIFIGDIEPTSNVGPWLKGGTQWYVWDDAIKRYVPLDISASETVWFWHGASVPPSTPPFVWLKTTKDATDADPTIGTPIGWYLFDGANWVAFNSIVASGPTTSRPTAPVEYQQFYDTSIAVLLWFERGQWRTVSGVPGDVKFVIFETLDQALAFNPGWVVLGNNNQTWRGRLIVQAAQDAGPSPATTLSVGPNIAQRSALETFGEDQAIKVDGASTLRYPGTIAMWTLVKQ
jgi:hypothetical protein